MPIDALQDALLVFGSIDISGDTNLVRGEGTQALQEYFAANEPGLTGPPLARNVIISRSLKISGGGYVNFSRTERALNTNVGRSDAPVMIGKGRAVGDPIVWTLGARAEYSPEGTVADTWRYNFAAMANRSLFIGRLGAYADVSADGPGPGFQFGATLITQKLYLLQLVERLSGTGTLVTTWKSAVASNFAGETTRATFASFPDVDTLGEQSIAIDGAITDEHHRPVFDVTGTGVFRVRIGVAIQLPLV